MQDNTKWYWEKSQQQNNIIVPTLTFIHPCLDVMEVTEVKQIPKSVCSINQACKALKRCPICITDLYHDFILDKIKRRHNIQY